MSKPDIGEIVYAVFSDIEIVPALVTKISPGENGTWLGSATLFTAGRQPWDVKIRIHESDVAAKNAVHDNYTYNCWQKEDKVKTLLNKLLEIIYDYE